jgi:class 3 adenylate cyclase
VSRRHIRSFANADEVAELDQLRTALIRVGGVAITRDTHLPGWRWSTHVKPIVKTESCRFRHLGYVISGQLHVVLDDGTELDANAGDVMDIPPGHDAWVVGEEPFETLAWTGGRDWLIPLGGEAERVVATMTLSDIVASTDVARRVGDRNWADLLGHFQAGTREIVTRFGGRVVDFAGDGVLAVFDGAARAIRCAEALREAAEDLGLKLRSAVHSAEVERDGLIVRGVGVHEASRILGLAGPGEILVSDVTAALARDAGPTLTDRGEHELRGLARTRHLFAVDESDKGG